MSAGPFERASASLIVAGAACWFLVGCATPPGEEKVSGPDQPKPYQAPPGTAANAVPPARPAPVAPTTVATPSPAPVYTYPPQTVGGPQVAPTPTPAPPPSGRPKFSDAELQKLVAPIALYPDPLLAIVLTASTYPLEIVQAARFVKDTNNIPKIDQQPWDDKVKGLARFPEVIAKMDADLDWTSKLGQAFLEQPMDLMNALQELRTKAQAAGKLKTTPQQVVTVTNSVVERTYNNQIVYVTNTVVQVQPASTQVIYVPTYNPSTVYVEDNSDEAAAAVISFGVGMAFGAAMWGDCDWHYGGCYWGGYPPYPPPYPPPYYPPPGARPPSTTRPPGTERPPPGERPPGERPGNRPPGESSGNRPGQTPGGRPPSASTMPAQRWQPNQGRLSAAGSPSVSTREARGWGGDSPARVDTRPSTGMSGTRPSTGNVGARPSTGINSGNRGSASPSVSQRDYSQPSSSRSSYDRSSGSNGSAFGGTSSGSSARSYSSRGSSSRSGGFSGGRGGRGR